MPTSSISGVLKDFSVASAADYGRLRPGDRTHFVRRLFKASEAEFSHVVREIPSLGGLKLHYDTEEQSGRVVNAPTSAFLKRLLFYSNRSVVSYSFQPFDNPRQLQRRGPWGGERMYFGDILPLGRKPQGGRIGEISKSYWVDRVQFDDFVNLCCQLSPVLDTGYVHLIPTFPDSERDLRRGSLGLTSANFRLKALQGQFEERLGAFSAQRRSPLGVTKLLLPHFSNVPVERLVEIREHEADRYLDFQRSLENLLAGSGTLQSEEGLLNFMYEVDEGVRKLDMRFRQIQREYQRKNITLLIKLVVAGLVMFAPLDAKEAIGGILGTMSAFDYLSSANDYIEKKSNERNRDFYLPWLVFKA